MGGVLSTGFVFWKELDALNGIRIGQDMRSEIHVGVVNRVIAIRDIGKEYRGRIWSGFLLVVIEKWTQ